MTMFSIILSSLSLILLIISMVIAKKPTVLALLLWIVNCLFILIKLIDPAYYNEVASIYNSSDDLDKVLFTFSFILFVFCLILFLVKLVVKFKKVNYGRDNAPIFSNSKELITDNEISDETYASLTKEFNSSSVPMIMIDDNIRINEILKELLGLNKNELDLIELDKFIHKDDKEAYKSNHYFRISNENYSDWFEKRSLCYHGKRMCVIRRIDEKSYSLITVKNYDDLKKELYALDNLDNLENQKNKYGLLFIKIKHIIKFTNMDNLEVDHLTLRILLTCKYLISIKDFFKNQNIKVFKLSNSEFMLLITNKACLDFLIDKLKNDDNALSDYVFFIDDKKYMVQSRIVLLRDYVKKEVDDNALIVINKAMEELICENKDSIVLCGDESINNKLSIDNINIKEDIRK